MTVTLDLAHLLASSAPEDAAARRTLSSLSLAVARARRVVVVTGAGISCSCGIPDFRSSDGLYNLVKSRYPDVVLKGRDLFDASLFRSPESTALFYTFMAELKAAIDAAQPSRTHEFLKVLDRRGKLLRSYTQNIDGLEQRAGLSTAAGPSREGKENDAPSPSPAAPQSSSIAEPAKPKPKPKGKSLKSARNVQLHGDIHAVRCTLCAYTAPFSPEHTASFREGKAPACPACTARCEARLLRAARSIPTGSLRPAIVLYDEPHPLGEEIGTVQGSDLSRAPDLLIIMGTSLKVHGLKRLVREFAAAVHARAERVGGQEGKGGKKQPAMLGKVLFVNRTPPSSEWAGVIDYHVQGETDAWVARVEEEWRRLRPQDWEVQTTLDELPAKARAKVSKPGLPLLVKDKPVEKEKKRPKARRAGNGNSSDAENIPLSQTSALSGKTLVPTPRKEKLVPLSPSKRANLANHYDSDASPRKKRSPGSGSDKGRQEEAGRTPLGERNGGFKEKGLLFGSPSRAQAREDLGLEELSLVTPVKRRSARARLVPVRA
ncbi:DHS-like NAD/FAD-binding domain-containing protein [Calocera viscosa TUFC12733]|uniref:DHS-like NAD/FAD-binding domain-containing protein n=1 Tax=Calocera viscosa (strain TUFC12733) TaxID=1330018 RepID=A0A167G5Y4_CALVF|nr:DHS-like NAD/FAD-binding domain-containing protein [Calocera viscosa TUFC12733]